MGIKVTRDGEGLFSLSALAEAVEGKLVYRGVGKDVEGRVAEVVIDSRKVKNDDLFVALNGSRESGERYVAEAFERGAIAVLCRHGGAERIGVNGIYLEVDDALAAVIRIAKRVRSDGGFFVAGVTGSVGKTTVKELCLRVLGERFSVDGTRGNYNNQLGLSLSILNAFCGEKTGGIRGKSEEKRRRFLVLEMGISHVGDMEELTSIARPDVAVITNVGSMHAEYLGGRAGVASEKARVASLGVDSVICPNEAMLLGEILRYVDAESVTALSCEDGSWTRGEVSEAVIRFSEKDGEFSVILADETGQNKEYGRFTAPIVGKHGVWDSALAVILGVRLGLGRDEIASGLSKYTPISMRQEIRRDGGIIRVSDCYNSGPESVRAALSALEEYARKYGCARRVAVLGDMLELGDASQREHYELGRSLVGYGVELLFAVGTWAEWIAVGALENGFSESRVTHYGEGASYELIKKEIGSRVRDGDIILYKASRGMGFERLLPDGKREG